MHTHTYIHRQLKRDIDILWHITNAKSRLWLLMSCIFSTVNYFNWNGESKLEAERVERVATVTTFCAREFLNKRWRGWRGWRAYG